MDHLIVCIPFRHLYRSGTCSFFKLSVFIKIFFHLSLSIAFRSLFCMNLHQHLFKTLRFFLFFAHAKTLSIASFHNNSINFFPVSFILSSFIQHNTLIIALSVLLSITTYLFVKHQVQTAEDLLLNSPSIITITRYFVFTKQLQI